MYDPASKTNKMKKLDSTIVIITISFGINPVRGGTPANDNIKSIKIAGIRKWTLLMLNKSKMVFEFVIMNVRNTGVTVMQYIMK